MSLLGRVKYILQCVKGEYFTSSWSGCIFKIKIHYSKTVYTREIQVCERVNIGKAIIGGKL